MGKHHSQFVQLTGPVVSFVEMLTWFFTCASAEEKKYTNLVPECGS